MNARAFLAAVFTLSMASCGLISNPIPELPQPVIISPPVVEQSDQSCQNCIALHETIRAECTYLSNRASNPIKRDQAMSLCLQKRSYSQETPVCGSVCALN